MTKRRVHPAELARLAVIALFFLAAPTAGDIGSCSQRADDLDPARFFLAKQNLDCARCIECKLSAMPAGAAPDGGPTPGGASEPLACKLACGPTLPLTFPKHCYPVVHDGEVCLDALNAASCADYQSFTADQGSTIPTECVFCPPRADGGT